LSAGVRALCVDVSAEITAIEPQVLPDLDNGKAIDRAGARVLIDPGQGHVQVAGRLVYGEEVVLPDIAVVIVQTDSRGHWGGYGLHRLHSECARLEDPTDHRTEKGDGQSVRGKALGHGGRDMSRDRKRVSADSLVRSYRKETQRQKLLIKRATLSQTRLLFVVNALRRLLADENFVTLLRAEGMQTLPRPLVERLNGAGL
jgi:hypothetical protein